MHGEDVIVKAHVRTAEWLKQELAGRYERKTHVIGGAADLGKELQILKRTVRWSPQRLWREKDRRHRPHARVGAKAETRSSDSESRQPGAWPGRVHHVSSRRCAPQELVSRYACHHLRNDQIVLHDVSTGGPGSAEVKESGQVLHRQARHGLLGRVAGRAGNTARVLRRGLCSRQAVEKVRQCRNDLATGSTSSRRGRDSRATWQPALQMQNSVHGQPCCDRATRAQRHSSLIS